MKEQFKKGDRVSWTWLGEERRGTVEGICQEKNQGQKQYEIHIHNDVRLTQVDACLLKIDDKSLDSNLVSQGLFYRSKKEQFNNGDRVSRTWGRNNESKGVVKYICPEKKDGQTQYMVYFYGDNKLTQMSECLLKIDNYPLPFDPDPDSQVLYFKPTSSIDCSPLPFDLDSQNSSLKSKL